MTNKRTVLNCVDFKSIRKTPVKEFLKSFPPAILLRKTPPHVFLLD